ncbi:MAG TPA: plastocyanin/azurin family copper-binding protein [Blastocatellia bacterium]|nr:plastocyanin/azurin family copper-binding protein [Blastocatellia bacterium]
MLRTLAMLLMLAALSLSIGATPQKKDGKKAEPQSPTVKVSNFKFEPQVLRVKVGTTVIWTVEGGNHTVISDGSTFTSQKLSQGQSFSHQFTKAGKYPYYCSFHGDKGGKDMSGTIIVTP